MNKLPSMFLEPEESNKIAEANKAELTTKELEKEVEHRKEVEELVKIMDMYSKT